MATPSSYQRVLPFTFVLVALGCAAPAAAAQVPDSVALVSLHRQLLESVFLRGDSALLAATALPNAVVVPPGGLVESRQQLLTGIRNTLSDSITIDDVVIVHHGTTAVIVARFWASLPDGPRPRAGPSRMMSVFVYDDSTWRLLARSVTPCLDRAISAGRC